MLAKWEPALRGSATYRVLGFGVSHAAVARFARKRAPTRNSAMVLACRRSELARETDATGRPVGCIREAMHRFRIGDVPGGLFASLRNPPYVGDTAITQTSAAVGWKTAKRFPPLALNEAFTWLSMLCPTGACSNF